MQKIANVPTTKKIGKKFEAVEMKIRFEFVDDQHIKIIGVEEKDGVVLSHEMGRIITPSGSGGDTKNAIQVCGFSEAFDFWGCGYYGIEKTEGEIDMLKRHGHLLPWNRSPEFNHVKDIQLLFDIRTVKLSQDEVSVACDLSLDNCLKCYNRPCTCEIHANHDNPYVPCRGTDLRREKVEEAKHTTIADAPTPKPREVF